MDTNYKDVPDTVQAILDERIDRSGTSGDREVVKFSSFYAAATDTPDVILMMAAPLLNAVAQFVQQNYTWNGTRDFEESA